MIKLIKYQNIILLTSLVCLPVFFQNCSVKTSDNSLPIATINRTPNSVGSTDGTSTGVSTDIKTCSINNQIYKPGDTVLGYVTNSAVSPSICGEQISRKCLDSGFFDISSPLYTTCNQQCLHPDSSQVMNSGSTYVYFTKKSGTSQADCDAAKKTSSCSGVMPTMGIYVPAIPTTRYTTCLVAGQTCAYTATADTATPTGYMAGATVNGYVNPSATFPTLCGAKQTLTCKSTGSWGANIPLYKACVQKCIHPDSKQPVDQNTTFVYYTSQSGTQTQCNAAKVTATCSATTGQFVVNGTTNGAIASSRFSNCNVQIAPTITSFSATPSSISSGSSTSLSWATMNATQIKLNNVDVTGTSIKSVAPTTTTVYTLSAINSLGTVTATTTVTVTAAPVDPLMGRALYDSKCSACHGAFDVSTLKGRTITVDKISNSMVTISAMSFLKGTLTTSQLTSIENLFTTVVDPGTGTTTSNFSCNSTEAEKNSSLNLIRLTGTELKNTYQALIPSAVWTALSTYYYLLPVDNFEGLITNFVSTYNTDNVEQISRFNEHIANQIVSSSSNISSFFGTCATTSSFPKTCFDSFLTSKGPLFFRSALATDDNATLWASVTKATAVTDQLKILVQLVFNDPRFLYHIELGDGTAADANGLLALSSYEIANRISYGMTAAPADSTLWTDATQNKLKNLTTISTHVDRISKTTAFKNRVIEFVKFYVGLSVAGTAPLVTEFLNGINGTGLDTAVTNEFNEYISYVVFTQNGTLTDLLTSQAAFPKTSTLATIMGTSVWSSGSPVTAVNHPGLLSKPYMQLVSNPNLKLVQRGRRIRMNMLCTDVPQPSAADLAARPNLAASDLVTLNRRQYIEKATMTGASCIACHSKMNQLGYATESYDSIGRFITTEKIYNSTDVKVAEHPVVTTSTPSIIETDTRTFNGLKEVELALAQSDTLQQCLSRKTFQFFLRKQENLTNDSCRLNKMDTQIKTGMPLLNFFVENFKQQSMMYKRSN